MTTETKAPTAEDVKTDAQTVLAHIDSDLHNGAIGALSRLQRLALLGVQVPGLQEQLQGVTDRWEDAKAAAAGQHLDSLSASRREVSALQARVAELERRLNQRAVDELALERLSTRVTSAESERDALRAQVERMRKIGSQFANAAYNLSQLERGEMTAKDREILKRLQVEWDAALSTPPAETPTPVVPVRAPCPLNCDSVAPCDACFLSR